MGDGVLFTPPPLFSFVYGPAFTYLCTISHHCNASESNFKENLGIQDILIYQKSSNLVNSPLLVYATRVEVWDNMAWLQWWFHSQRSDWSEISEWLTYRNCELIFFVACIYPWNNNKMLCKSISKFLMVRTLEEEPKSLCLITNPG